MSPLEYFSSLHENFKSLKIPHVCYIESNKSYIRHINNYVYIVKPDSAILPDIKNIFGEDKFHSNIQKFKPNKMNDPIFINFCEIKNNLIFYNFFLIMKLSSLIKKYKYSI